MPNLRKLFADICNGYSSFEYEGKTLYLKHISHFDQVEIAYYEDKYFQKAKKDGIPTEEEQLKWLEKEGLWTKKEEGNLNTLKFYLENLIKTQSKLSLKSQIDAHKKTIEKAKKDYDAALEEKEKLVGITCEKFSKEKVFAYYIFLSFFNDSQLKNPLFKKTDFNEIEDEEIAELSSIYFSIISDFNEKNIKQIAISDFFTSYYHNCENAFEFYGKPVYQLTFNQLNLIFFGKYFKIIFENNEIPKEIRNDAEKIEEYITANRNIKESIEKTSKKSKGDHQFTGVVGTREDLKYAGLDTNDGFNKKLDKAVDSTIEQADKIFKI